jgi:hypothetical protein
VLRRRLGDNGSPKNFFFATMRDIEEDIGRMGVLGRSLRDVKG